MFIKKKKVKIIIQGSAPLQFPEVTFARKSQDYSSCKLAQSQRSKPTPATSPAGETGSLGEDARTLVPPLRTPSPSPQNSQPTLFPSQVQLGRGETLVPLQKPLPPHPIGASAKLHGPCTPDPRNSRKFKK